LEVSGTSLHLWIKLGLLSMLMFFAFSWLLVRFTDTQVPFLDAATTALSIVATWMMAKKKLEHWLIWIVVDTISIGMFILKGLYPTTLLFSVYTILAVYGYFEWKKAIKPTECEG
jgi:nicotinamide mononucleotide transporter